MTKLLPAIPMPRPSDKRQLVATIRPTQVDMALGNPNFFVVACIKITSQNVNPYKKALPKQANLLLGSAFASYILFLLLRQRTG
jgi:hypothetical protein